MTWDDHETENDYAGVIPENPNDPADNAPDFLSRRARAYQTYYEHMPIRAAQLPVGPSLQLYRRLRVRRHAVGQRARHPTVPIASRAGIVPDGRADRRLLPERARSDADDPGRGTAGVVDRGLDRSTARWNLLGNQVPFAPNDTNADPAIRDSRRREVGRLSGRPSGRARFHQQPRADQHRRHHRRRPSELRPERAAGSRAARRRVRSPPSSSARRSRAAATVPSAPWSAATPTTRISASPTTTTVTFGAQSPPICGALTTASCHQSRSPTMAESERLRRLSSSSHDRGRSQPERFVGGGGTATAASQRYSVVMSTMTFTRDQEGRDQGKNDRHCVC